MKRFMLAVLVSLFGGQAHAASAVNCTSQTFMNGKPTGQGPRASVQIAPDGTAHLHAMIGDTMYTLELKTDGEVSIGATLDGNKAVSATQGTLTPERPIRLSTAYMNGSKQPGLQIDCSIQ